MLWALCLAFEASTCMAQDAAKAVEQADKALTEGDYDTAIRRFNEAIRLDPKFARAYHGRGVAYFYKG
jgi:Flp pilus assembly protein TadD